MVDLWKNLGVTHMSEKTTIYLPEKIKKAIKILVVIEETFPSMNDFILEACKEKLAKEGVNV
jgi:hypothetical protein